MRQKRSDFETIPLCRAHHDEQHRTGWKAFIDKYDLDIPALLAVLSVKPRINRGIVGPSDRYWMTYQGEMYALTTIQHELKNAIALAQEFRRDWLIEHIFTSPKAKTS